MTDSQLKYQSKEIRNFLEPSFFKHLQNTITHHSFPWRKTHKTTAVDTDWHLYFYHNFFDDKRITSEYYNDLIIPILDKLNVNGIIQARSNLFISKTFDKSSYHTDQFDERVNTAILYLNDCDGGTEFKSGEFVRSEANKMVIFNSSLEHRAQTARDVPCRYIINLNYYEKLY